MRSEEAAAKHVRRICVTEAQITPNEPLITGRPGERQSGMRDTTGKHR